MKSPAALNEALQCSERMLSAARAGQWDELAELQGEREALLSMAAGGHNDGVDVDAECITRMLIINEEILHLGTVHRDELMRACADSRQASRVAGAYAAGTRT
ncbi:MAG: flagellar protein FliT [Chromatiales bacterium]|jgi:hypothetical protein|nr:flagellar protein FliT [Chromatiales bacterium]